MPRDYRPVGVQPHRRGSMRRQPAARARVRHHQPGAGVRQHEGEALRRIIRVERQVGAPRLEDAEKPDDHRSRALDAQPDDHLRPNPEPAQVMRQPARQTVKLRVGDLLIPMHHRDRIRRPRRLRGKQFRNRPTRQRMRRRVPIPQDGVALLRPKNLQAANRSLRTRNRRLQKTNQPIAQRLNASPIEQVGGVFKLPLKTRWPAVRPASLRKAQRQVELGARRRNRLRRYPQTRKIKTRRRIVLQRQHHLEQRMTRQRPRRIENLNQTLERKVLMRIRRKVASSNPSDELPEARIARRVGAQNKRVDEEPDKIVQRAVGATRYRAADRDVAARSKPRQKTRKPSLQHHEQARTTLPRQTHKPAVKLRADPNRYARPPIARLHRSRTVDR